MIVGHLIPAGTGQRKFNDIFVANKEEYERLSGESQVEEVVEEAKID